LRICLAIRFSILIRIWIWIWIIFAGLIARRPIVVVTSFKKYFKLSYEVRVCYLKYFSFLKETTLLIVFLPLYKSMLTGFRLRIRTLVRIAHCTPPFCNSCLIMTCFLMQKSSPYLGNGDSFGQ